MAEIAVKVADVEDKQEIYDLFLSSFFPDMPLFPAMNVPLLDMDEWPALQTLDKKMTLLAVSKHDEIMGYAMNVVPNEGEIVAIPGPLENLFDFIEEDSKGLLSKLEKSTMELRVLCVGKKWRGNGIAKKLVEESENLAKKLGYKNIFGMATGAYMELAFKNKGWNCVYRLSYKDYHEHHNKNFKVPDDPHTSLTLYEKTF